MLETGNKYANIYLEEFYISSGIYYLDTLSLVYFALWRLLKPPAAILIDLIQDFLVNGHKK